MKVDCAVEKLKEAVMVAERSTGKNLTLPALASILCVATEKTLKIRATNLNVGIEITIPAKVINEGVVAVKGDILSGLLGNLSSGTITLEEINGNLSITAKSFSATVKCIPHEDFPTLPTVEGSMFTIPTNTFIEGCKSVMFSASVSDIKPELAAVYIYPENDTLVFVATDSFRLAEKKVKLKHPQDIPSVLIPAKNTVDIMRILEREKGEVKVTFSANQASFVTETVYITSRLVQGSYPDYRQIIPKTTSTSAVILKNDLQQALKISNIFSDKFNQITLSIQPSKKECILSSKNSDVGEQKTNLSAALQGEPVEVSINFKYLHDVFQVIGSDSISILSAEQNRPLIVRGVGDQSFLYLVMPMSR